MSAKKASLQNVLTRMVASQPEEKKRDISTKKVIFVIPAAAKKQVDFMSVELDRTKQDLFKEALNDLFQKYSKERIA